AVFLAGTCVQFTPDILRTGQYHTAKLGQLGFLGTDLQRGGLSRSESTGLELVHQLRRVASNEKADQQYNDTSDTPQRYLASCGFSPAVLEIIALACSLPAHGSFVLLQ